MKIYHYHPEYKCFVCEGIADPSPLDPPGVWLIPAHATDIEPPEYTEGFIPVFNGTSWEVIEDKRGIYYNIISGSSEENYNPLKEPENTTKEVPPEIPENKILKWNNGWILENIPEPKELTPQEKLESVGLSIEDLKILLGLS